jgi:hypothetical protein
LRRSKINRYPKPPSLTCDKKAFRAEFLYLSDYRFSDKWSMMNMLGLRHTAIGKSGDSLITAFFTVIPNIHVIEIELLSA